MNVIGKIGQAAGHPRTGGTSSGGGWRSGLLVLLGFLAMVAIAGSWLVFPYFLDGRDLLSETGTRVKTLELGRANTLARSLTRVADGQGEAEIDVLWAVPAYLEAAASGDSLESLEPGRYHIFLVNESTHTETLPAALPQAVLRVDGREIAAAEADGPEDVEHHRTTAIRFPRFDDSGNPTVPADARSVELHLTGLWDGAAGTPRRAGWRLPLDLPEEAASIPFAPVLLLALSAGLLSAVLTPCLIQMLVVYVAALTGFGAETVRGGGGPRAVLPLAIAFTAGFTVLYTAAGALIGYLGSSAQQVFSDINRPAGIAAGALIIAVAIWSGVRAQAPLICRVPLPAALREGDGGGMLRSALLSGAVALGCLTCFSGAIIGTLLLYVGVVGSAPIGATVMAVFSLGVAVPFLAAAFFLSRARSLTTALARYAPALGLANVAVMIGFGLILITDNFHVVSNAIYPWLGLPG